MWPLGDGFFALVALGVSEGKIAERLLSRTGSSDIGKLNGLGEET
jgi:hypothetical protein